MKYIANETLMMAGRLIAAGQAIDLEPEHAEMLGELVSPAAEGKGKKAAKSEPEPAAAETETVNTTSNESQKEGDQP